MMDVIISTYVSPTTAMLHYRRKETRLCEFDIMLVGNAAGREPNDWIE
jgi:hypothetical protein